MSTKLAGRRSGVRSPGTCTRGWTRRNASSTPRPGAGSFITQVPAAERWGVDLVKQGDIEAAGVRMIIADIMDAELPECHFDGVFLSNFLEHLPSQDAVADVLGKLRGAMAPRWPDRGHRAELPLLRSRVLRLRRPRRDAHPRVDGRAPVRRPCRDWQSHPKC